MAVNKAMVVLFGAACALSACSAAADTVDGLVDDAGVTTPTFAASSDGGEALDAGARCEENAQAQAFPDDPEFRLAVCDAMFAMIDNPTHPGVVELSQRVQAAILSYADDRDAALAEVRSVVTAFG